MLCHRSKYHAKKAEYRGESYDSLAEAAYARHLDAEIERGAILWYLRQPKFSLGVPENVYRPDFLVIAEAWVAADDVKGTETAKFRRDRKLWLKYGPCPLRVVRLKLRYSRAGSGELPSIAGVVLDGVPGGLDRRDYGALCQE